MQRKLQCILVDDDPSVHDIFKEYLKDNEYAEITDYFQDPRDFIKAKKKAELVFIDIVMPYVDGFTLAYSIKPTPVILFTGDPRHFKDILDMVDAIDVFPKPIVRERLLKSVKDAFVLLTAERPERGFAFFHTDEGRVNIMLSNILFVRAVKNTHGTVELFLKGDNKIIIKGYTIEYIHDKARFLAQSNRAELLSPMAIGLFEHNVIHLIGVSDKNKPICSTLTRNFRVNFLAYIPEI